MVLQAGARAKGGITGVGLQIFQGSASARHRALHKEKRQHWLSQYLQTPLNTQNHPARGEATGFGEKEGKNSTTLKGFATGIHALMALGREPVPVGHGQGSCLASPHPLLPSHVRSPGNGSGVQGAAHSGASLLLPWGLLGCQAASSGFLLPGLPRGSRCIGLEKKYRGGRAVFSLSPTCFRIAEVKHLEQKRSLECLALQESGAQGRIL